MYTVLKHNSCCASVHPAHASALLMWFDVGTIGLHYKKVPTGMSSRPSRDARKKLHLLIQGVVKIITAFPRKKGKSQKYRNLRKPINIRDVRWQHPLRSKKMGFKDLRCFRIINEHWPTIHPVLINVVWPFIHLILSAVLIWVRPTLNSCFILKNTGELSRVETNPTFSTTSLRPETTLLVS